MNGLCITKEEFQGMKIKDQLTTLYDNQCKQLDNLYRVERLINRDTLWKKITTVSTSTLALVVGWLFYMHLK